MDARLVAIEHTDENGETIYVGVWLPQQGSALYDPTLISAPRGRSLLELIAAQMSVTSSAREKQDLIDRYADGKTGFRLIPAV